ncbi:MAG: 23S rRNA (adenine(2503)-C(2))-methyltransferase RlmN, partial [Clostridia bacterium]|nr:23S rRNA (adenine(2503)-C(2))-methyltransferase RlmN [Clostridia bacterium]
MSLIDIKSLTNEDLAEQIQSLGYPAFRAKQIRSWLDNGVTSFEAMTNLPAAMRTALSERYTIPCVAIEKKLVSQIDGTVKYLFRLPDGETVESVLMNYHHGWSQCLSTQVGCRMGCSFCATGKGGLVRNMTASEIYAQIEAAQADHGVRVSSIVLMGMGEPLDNYDEVVRFLEMVSEEGGVQIGMRHISLSTCGLVDRIEKLMERRFQLTLSISLHAPNDTLRRQLMPIAKKWSVDELLDVCRRYIDCTGRRISFEYAMVDGVT